DAQRQLGTGHAGRARNRDAAVFVERSAVEHHQIGAAADERVEFASADARRRILVLDELAERLAWNVDAGKELAAQGGPCTDPAPDGGNVGVARLGEDAPRTRRESVVVVAKHDPG